MHDLSEEECQTLLAIVVGRDGLVLCFDEFAEVVLGLFEDIPGLETIPPAKSWRIVNQLWSMYMGKKPASVASTNTIDGIEAGQAGASASKQVKIDLGQPTIRAAMEQGQAMIAEGKTKADAARAIYGKIKGEPKDVIVAAFVAGAALTEKGALTYWYNCRRKAAKDAARSKSGPASGS